MPKLHPRTLIVQQAENELSLLILDWIQKNDLTYGEIVKLFAGQLQRCSKHMIRDERHPGDPDQPGDLE